MIFYDAQAAKIKHQKTLKNQKTNNKRRLFLLLCSILHAILLSLGHVPLLAFFIFRNAGMRRGHVCTCTPDCWAEVAPVTVTATSESLHLTLKKDCRD